MSAASFDLSGCRRFAFGFVLIVICSFYLPVFADPAGGYDYQLRDGKTLKIKPGERYDIIELPKTGEKVYDHLGNLPDNLWLSDDDGPVKVSPVNKSERKSTTSDEDRKKLLGDPKYTCEHGLLAWECDSCRRAWQLKQVEKSVPVYPAKQNKPGQAKPVTQPKSGVQTRNTTPAQPVQQPRHPDDPLPLEEPAEFWSAEDKEVIETVVGGVAVLGGAGLGLYALLSSLGLIGAKAGAGATAAAVSTGVAVATGTATTGAAAAGYSAGAAEVALPKAGDARSYLDEHGTRWVEVFDGNNWVDSATSSANQAQAADNQAWQQREFERQSTGDTAFNRDLEAQAQKHAEKAAAIKDSARKEIRSINEFLQQMAEGDRKLAEIALAAKEQQLWALEKTKTVIDCVALPLIGATLGPAATLVSGLSTIGSEIAAGATEGFIHSDTVSRGVVNAVKGGAKGAVAGAASVVISEGLNAVAAVGSRVGRTLWSDTPLKVVHRDSSGAELIKKLWGNFKDGNALTKGFAKNPPQIPPPYKLRANIYSAPLIAKRGLQIAKIKKDLAWGAASGLKSYFIDSSLASEFKQVLF